jgi:alpha-glucosidase
MYQEGYEKLILVGIDSPNDDLKRMVELAPNIKTSRFEGRSLIGIADKYINFILDELLPYISNYFPISLNKEDIGIGGSSMGGLMSFYAALIRGNDFKFCLSFSPAFLLYSNKKLMEMINDININNLPKIFFFVGGEGFEASFVKKTLKMYNSLKKLGMNKDNLRLIYDSNKIHHESSWNAYLEESLSFFLNK